jgi:hypothetical protein
MSGERMRGSEDLTLNSQLSSTLVINKKLETLEEHKLRACSREVKVWCEHPEYFM